MVMGKDHTFPQAYEALLFYTLWAASSSDAPILDDSKDEDLCSRFATFSQVLCPATSTLVTTVASWGIRIPSFEYTRNHRHVITKPSERGGTLICE